MNPKHRERRLPRPEHEIFGGYEVTRPPLTSANHPAAVAVDVSREEGVGISESLLEDIGPPAVAALYRLRLVHLHAS